MPLGGGCVRKEQSSSKTIRIVGQACLRLSAGGQFKREPGFGQPLLAHASSGNGSTKWTGAEITPGKGRMPGEGADRMKVAGVSFVAMEQRVWAPLRPIAVTFRGPRHRCLRSTEIAQNLISANRPSFG